MPFLTYLATFLILWGAATLFIAVRKPDVVWKIGKIQGFVQLLGDQGAAILFGVIGAAALVGGIVWLIS